MKKFTTGILANVDAGKTTLSEGLLFESGVIKSPGRVDNKDAFLDNDEVERRRGITVYSKNARIPLGKDKELILVDTPGHADFSAETERTLKVLDVALLLIGANEGIRPQTVTLWKLLSDYGIPVIIFVNKTDMPGVDKDELFSSIKTKLSQEAVRFDEINKENLYENIATASEEALDEYMNNKSVSEKTISNLITDRKLFPVLFGSALKNDGVKDVINLLDEVLSYYQNADEGGSSLGAFCYKISKDKKNNTLYFLKVMSGSIKLKDEIKGVKVNEIRLYNGERYESVQSAGRGEILALVGNYDISIGESLGEYEDPRPSYLEPVMKYKVVYPKDVDNIIMLSYLREIEKEEPTLKVTYDEDTKEIFVMLMGEVLTEVLKGRILERYDIDVDFAGAGVKYKETVDAVAEGVGHFEPLRHYAEVHLKIEPLKRGSGLVFDTEVSEDDLSRNWQRLILTHLNEKEHSGVLTGSSITDMKITLIAGKAHIKHTEGGDFRQATYRAVRQGLMTLKSSGNIRLLEPYSDFVLDIPTEYVGRAMTDINMRNGKVFVSEASVPGRSTLTGEAPSIYLNTYAGEVALYTKGDGKLSYSFKGYDLCHNEEEVISGLGYDPDADLKNPSGSVFCSHGAGVVIPWYEVPDHMHLEYALKDDADYKIDTPYDLDAIRLRARERAERNSSRDFFLGVEEIDDILRKSTHANESGRTGAHKGISAAMNAKRRSKTPARELDFNETSPVYKGTPSKDKYILVDGYNLIHAWDELKNIMDTTLDGASGRLNDILCNYQAVTGQNLIVVYDAYKVKGHATEVISYNNITVVYTKEAQTADQYIERYAHDNSKKYDITVVTSDGLEQVIVTGAGSSIKSSREFIAEISKAFKDFNETHNVK